MHNLVDNLASAMTGLKYALRHFWPVNEAELGSGFLENVEHLVVGGQPVEDLVPTALRSVFCRVWGWQGENRFLSLKALNGDAEAIYPVSRER